MTPTQLMPTLILRALMIVGTEAGSTTIVSICSLVAPSVLMRSCFSPVISSKPASTVITVTTRDISKPIMIMLFTPAPNHTMSIGPKAIFGSALSTTRYGSSILARLLLHQRSMAISVPSIVPRMKPTTVS